MSQRIRFADIMDDAAYGIPSQCGVCPDSPKLKQWTNRFQERALNRGRWWGTTQLAQFCLTESSCGGVCIVLPREVAVIEAANLNGVPVDVQNVWGQFIRPHLPAAYGALWDVSGLPNCVAPTGWRCGCGCGCGGFPQMQDEELACSFNVTADGERIKVYATSIADYGKTVTIQGKDSNGLWVRTEIDGLVQDGERVTLGANGVLTATTWAAGAPYRIFKDATSYTVTMFAVAEDSSERQLASYEATETNPMYRKVRIPGVGGCGSGGCGQSRTLRCLVSLQHIPVTQPNDWLLFTNMTAYTSGIYSEKLRENGNLAEADAYFFGQPRPARNRRGPIMNSVGEGAIGALESELRKITGDRTAVSVQRGGVNLYGFV